MKNNQSELNLFELEKDYVPRMVVTTEKFETEDQHTQDKFDKIVAGNGLEMNDFFID